MNGRTYDVGRSRITVFFGDITLSRAEVIVSSDDFMLSMGGGVSAAICRAGGDRVAADASKVSAAKVGDVVVTTAGDLPARYVLHAISIGPRAGEVEPDAIVRQATRRIMELTRLLGCRSVAFPAIGGGVARIPYETVASEMAGTLVECLLDAEEPYEVELYLLDPFRRLKPEDFFVFFEAFAARRFALTTTAVASSRVFEPPEEPGEGMNDDRTAVARRRHQVYAMLRHLDARRNHLEAELLAALGEGGRSPKVALSRLRNQLDEIQTLRRSYESELAVRDAPKATIAAPQSVFVSSTSIDLKPHRQAVRSIIENLSLRFIGMEEFTPSTRPPVDVIRQKVNEGEIYLGILGMRYGYVDPGTGLSMTELEYRQAVASNRPICMFVMDRDAPILAGMVEDDPARFAKLLEFRSHVMKVHTCALFADPADLARKAEAALKATART